MRFKVVALSILLSMPVLSLAGGDDTITMPSAEVLKERLEKKGLDDLMGKTGIIKEMADKELSSTDVNREVERVLCVYDKNLKKEKIASFARKSAALMRSNKTDIIKILLQGHPEILKGSKKRWCF